MATLCPVFFSSICDTNCRSLPNLQPRLAATHHEVYTAMSACTCTCSTARRMLASSSLRHLTTSATRRIRPTAVNQDDGNVRRGTSSSRLEWDASNKQWIKKTISRTPQQRPSPAERAKILQELKEQRLNEVTELGGEANDQVAAAAAKQADADAAGSGNASSSTSNTSSPEGGSTVSTSGRRYRRGQDSSSLHVKTGTTLKGVPIPVRPVPPESTDCCMTGCPRCVYDIYTEDLQIHFEAMDKACKELRKKGVPEDKWPVDLQKFANAANTAKTRKETSPDDAGKGYDIDDADGVSAFDIASQVVTNEIQDLDISLRTFLKFERELRQRRKREQMQRLALDHVSSMPTSTPSGSSARPNA